MVDTADRTQDPAPPAAGYGWRRWTALGVLSLCVLVPLMDLTMVSVALSAIGRDLHADTAQLQWIISGYILVTALFMPVASVVGGRVGYRRTLLCGLALFGAASAAGALAPNAQLLVATRLVMGLGASTVLPMMMALFRLLFRPEELRRAIGIAVGAVAVTNPFGPVITGVLVDGLSWDWIFLINVILVALALPLIRWLLPGARNPLPQTADLPSLLLLAAGSSTAIYGIVRAGEGWTRPSALAWSAVGLALLAGFVLRQRSAARPLVPYALFSTPRYLWSQAMLTVANSAWAGMLFAAPLYLIEVLGCSTIGVGLRGCCRAVCWRWARPGWASGSTSGPGPGSS